MRLNHLDLQVTDVDATSALFVDHLGFTPGKRTPNGLLAVLHGPDGFVLVLQRRKDDHPWPDGFHLGFLLPSADEVEAFHARASAAGLPISDVIRNARGTLTYLRHDGFLVEVSCNVPARPERRI